MTIGFALNMRSIAAHESSFRVLSAHDIFHRNIPGQRRVGVVRLPDKNGGLVEAGARLESCEMGEAMERDNINRRPEVCLEDLEPCPWIEKGRPRGIGESPEVPRLIVHPASLVRDDDPDCVTLHYPIHFKRDLPGHEQVFEDA